jgi:hypothetical protein
MERGIQPDHGDFQIQLNFGGAKVDETLRKGAERRNNGRTMADAPSCGGEVQGSFRRRAVDQWV